MKPEPLYYIPAGDDPQQVAGPYDLVQMAGLLRKKIITVNTPTLLEGEQDWEPFGARPQFLVAKEMPLDAVSMRSVKQSEDSQSLIPLPSVEWMVQAGAAVVGLLIACTIVYFISKANLTMGICFAVAGTAAALWGTCMIYVRLVDEDYITLLLITFVPFYDIFYFIVNIGDYLPYFLAKYAGGFVAAAALAGIATGNSTGAEELKSMLHLYGQ